MSRSEYNNHRFLEVTIQEHSVTQETTYNNQTAVCQSDDCQRHCVSKQHPRNSKSRGPNHNLARIQTFQQVKRVKQVAHCCGPSKLATAPKTNKVTKSTSCCTALMSQALRLLEKAKAKS